MICATIPQRGALLALGVIAFDACARDDTTGSLQDLATVVDIGAASDEGVSATCADGVTNGEETDVDCGGGACGGCPPGKHCSTGADCSGGACKNSVCTDGDGTFRRVQTFVVGMQPRALSIADFDGDGTPDLVVAYGAPGDAINSGVVTVLGKGTGTFGAPKRYAAGVPVDVATADWDEDGRPDLAVADIGDGQADKGGVRIFLGRGGGQLVEAPTLSGIFTTHVVVADFNRDGHADLAASLASDNSVRLFSGQGTGGFAPSVRTAVRGYPLAMIAADINGDSWPDLVVQTQNRSEVVPLIGNGDATFKPLQYLTVSGYGALTEADLDGDGEVDVVAGSDSGGGEALVFGTRVDGRFVQPKAYSIGGAAASYITSIVAADIDGDGVPDLVGTLSGMGMAEDLAVFPGEVFVLPSLEGRILGSASRSPVGDNPVAIAAGDLNRDGKIDLAVANRDSGDVSILLQR